MLIHFFNRTCIGTGAREARGALLVEAVVVVSLISLILLAAMQVTVISTRISRRALSETQAAFLLEEGTDAVRTIRDTSWASFSGFSTGTTYYLSYASGAWSLSGTANTIDGTFTRTVTIANVNRDTNDDIATSGGTLDAGTRKVTVTVSWNDGAGAISKTLSFYLANIIS